MKEYAKLITSAAGTAVAILQVEFAGQHWATIAIGVITTALVYLVPNGKATPGK